MLVVQTRTIKHTFQPTVVAVVPAQAELPLELSCSFQDRTALQDPLQRKEHHVRSNSNRSISQWSAAGDRQRQASDAELGETDQTKQHHVEAHTTAVVHSRAILRLTRLIRKQRELH
jgi:hypothetical protein